MNLPMLNRYILPSRCPPLVHASGRPNLSFSASTHKPRPSFSVLATRKAAPVDLYRQRERATTLRARIVSAESTTELKRKKGYASPASHSMPNPDPKLGATNCRSRRLRLSRQQNLEKLIWRRRPWLWRRLDPSTPQGRVCPIRRPLKLRYKYRVPTRWKVFSFSTRKKDFPLGQFSLGSWPKDTKWGSQQVTTGLFEKLDWDWVLNFRNLKTPRMMQDWTSLDTDQVIRHYRGLPPSQDPISEGLVRLQNYGTDRLWRDVMLWCLKYQKKQALMLLLATYKGRKYRPPRYMVSDSLECLTHRYLFKESTPDPEVLDVIWILTCSFIDGASGQEQSFQVAQHLIYTILRHSDDLRVLSLYSLLSLNKAVLHVNTILHLFERFVDMGRINLAMKLLRTIADTGFDLSYPPIQMACVKLLRIRVDSQPEYNLRSSILTQILEIGVKPNIHMLNTILLNASEEGKFADAWHIYGLAKENALIPDSVTYGVLLKGAELSGDVSNIEVVVREIQMNRDALRDLHLLGNMLNAVSLISPGDEFGAMLDVYRQHCDLLPLQTLSLCEAETRAPPDASCFEVWPTVHILSRMILAYVRRRQGSPALVHNYHRYYHCVKENHPIIAPLAKTDYVANAFIMAFGKSSMTLQHCVTVVNHMLELSSQKDAIPGSDTYKAPTVQTWSILVDAYFRHKQRHAAEKVLDMMRKGGLEADQVTWNSIIKGYANLQAVRATVNTVKAMEAAGFVADDYTARALGRLWIPDRLMELLSTSTAESPVHEHSHESILSPLDPEEQSEAKTALEEWESRIPKQVEKYLEVSDYLSAKEDQFYTETGDPSDSLALTA